MKVKLLSCAIWRSVNSMPLLHLHDMVLQHKRNFIYCLTWKIILYAYIYISMVKTRTDQITIFVIKWHCSSLCYGEVWNSVSKLKKLERADPSSFANDTEQETCRPQPERKLELNSAVYWNVCTFIKSWLIQALLLCISWFCSVTLSVYNLLLFSSGFSFRILLLWHYIHAGVNAEKQNLDLQFIGY
jgi:hypothetical protein